MAYQILIGSHCCKELPLGLEICLLFTISRHPPLLSSCLGWQSVRLLPPPLSKVTDSGWSLIQARNTGTSETQFLDFGGRVLLRKRHCSHERPRNPKFTSTPAYCIACSTGHLMGVVYLESHVWTPHVWTQTPIPKVTFMQDLMKATEGVFWKTWIYMRIKCG